jgi:hypothetical protein
MTVKCGAMLLMVFSLALAGINFVPSFVKERFSRHSASDSFPVLREGGKVKLAGVALSRRWNLLLITSPSCSICAGNRELHREVARLAMQRGIGFYIALPRGGDAGYLDLGTISHVDLEWKAVKNTLQGTPTLVLLNREAIVEKIWLGGLDGRRSSALIQRLLDLPVRTAP